MFFSMDNKHLISTIAGKVILLNYNLEGDEGGDIFLVEPYMWLVTGYLYPVSDENLSSVTLKAHLFLRLINISNQLGITE